MAVTALAKYLDPKGGADDRHTRLDSLVDGGGGCQRDDENDTNVGTQVYL